jgi:hypothetical protein
MPNSGGLLVVTFSLARIIAAFVALWLAVRYESRIDSYLTEIQASARSKAARVVIWFAMGALLAIPLFDLVEFVHAVARTASPGSWALGGNISTSWGNAPGWVFDLLSGLTTLAIYLVTAFLLWPQLNIQRLPSLAALAPARGDRILITASIAGMVNLIVLSVSVGVVSIQLPFSIRPPGNGPLGLVAAWLVGLALVLILAGLIRLRSPGTPHET